MRPRRAAIRLGPSAKPAPSQTVASGRRWLRPRRLEISRTRWSRSSSVPDGCTLDADGCVWSADEVGGRCARLAEGGEVLAEIGAPEGLNFFACALGGEDGRTMLICAAPDFLQQNRESATDAVLFMARVDVPHAGRP